MIAPSRWLWLLSGLLGVALAAELGLPERDPPAAQSPALQVNAGPPRQADPVGRWASAVLARPLFSPGRRPDAAASQTGEHLDLPRLSGIIVMASERRAIFASAGNGAPAIIVSEGGTVGGWQVEAVHPGDVQVAGPNGRRTLRPTYSDRPPAMPDKDPTQPPLAAPLTAAALQATIDGFRNAAGMSGQAPRQ